jgi:hypothetical protein
LSIIHINWSLSKGFVQWEYKEDYSRENSITKAWRNGRTWYVPAVEGYLFQLECRIYVYKQWREMRWPSQENLWYHTKKPELFPGVDGHTRRDFMQENDIIKLKGMYQWKEDFKPQRLGTQSREKYFQWSNSYWNQSLNVFWLLRLLLMCVSQKINGRYILITLKKDGKSLWKYENIIQVNSPNNDIYLGDKYFIVIKTFI